MSTKYQWALSRQAYTVTASSEATGHPDDNLALPQHPRRTWRDDGTGVGSTIIAQLSAPGALAAVLVYGGNVTQWTIEESATGVGGWSALTESPLVVGTDARVGDRRKGWFPITSTLEYIRLTVGTLAAGASYAELGVLDLYKAADIRTMARNPSNPVYKVRHPHTITDYDGGGFDVNEDGLPVMEYSIGGVWWPKRGSVDDLHAIRNAGPGAVVALFENNGTPAHCYLGRVLELTEQVRNVYRTEAALLFREVA